MKRKLTSVAEATPIRVTIVTMDPHLATAAARAGRTLGAELPGLRLSLHAAAEYCADDASLARCHADIAAADIVIVSMLFLEDHFLPVIDALRARREHCDAMVCVMSAGDVAKLTRIGKFSMDKEAGGALGMLKKLRGKPGPKTGSAGAQQMRVLRQLPRILRFIPGTAQDVRAYFLTLQYWLAGSEANLANLVRSLVGRYAAGPREALRGAVSAEPPVDYPDTGLYHASLASRVTDRLDLLPRDGGDRPTVGLLVLRSYVLAGNTGHYDGVVTALEARGLRVLPAFASGLDARPAIEKFFVKDGVPTIDALVSLTGFSLVGGPAYNDARAAEEILSKLDVPYLAAHPVEFQTLQSWGASERGLLPVENTIMVAIPELDGATGPIAFGGRVDPMGGACVGCERRCEFPASATDRNMHVCADRAEMLSRRVERLVRLRRSELAKRRVAVVIFNFPPNGGNTGTAAFLSVFQSLYRTLAEMKRAGYTVELPSDVDALREHLITGNAARLGAPANVHVRIGVDDHVRRERHLAEIEKHWGPAPGRELSDGRSLFVMGERFGNIFVGVQPSFGYEGDPMRLLFEKGFAPTHAFSAFYRWIREDFAAHAVLHFGTHGALEFMPGKQAGLSGSCWPDRLIGDLPNIYLYAANNPSEGAIAKRRSAATMISYLTPPVSHAGLYRGLLELKDTLDRWRALPGDSPERAMLIELLQAQAAAVDLSAPTPPWGETAEARIGALQAEVYELEMTLIPHGLHVVGEPPTVEARLEMLGAIGECKHGARPAPATLAALVAGANAEQALRLEPATHGESGDAKLEQMRELVRANELLSTDHEIPAMLRALDGKFIRPSPGGDVLRTPEVLPTGRNLHGFDPFRIPSVAAVQDGARQAQRLLARHSEQGQPLPETVAIVLWGTDNLKSEGGPIAQALALLGALPRFDSYGRLAGASLVPLAELGRPRVDVVITISGIFRDLLPLQIRLLAEASYLAAGADEPADLNFVRKHALAYQTEHGCDLETASLRVFGNAEGAYGSNVNNLVENGRWENEDELAETYTRRKGFAYGRNGRATQQVALLNSALAHVDLAYQNLDSVELGVTTVDNYFDTLGGISRAARRARGGVAAPVYIGDQTTGEGTVRTLDEQVALETRTRMLNPKWYEGMLAHGYEGVRQIEVHVTNTMGWSATTGQVAPWVYKQLTQTYILDPQMRERMAALNPTASAKVVNRLIEAHERKYWEPDEQMLEALRRAGEDLEDRLEGAIEGAAA